VSTDGCTLIAVTAEKQNSPIKYTVRLWNLAAGKEWHSLESAFECPKIAFSDDSRFVTCVTTDELRVFSIANAAQVRQERFDDFVRAFALNGNTIALANRLGEIKLLDFATVKSRLATGDPTGQIMELRFLDRDSHLLTDGETRVVWDWRNGRALKQILAKGILSPDLSMRASCVAGVVVLQNTATGEIIRVFWADAYDIAKLSFSKDSRTLFTRQGRVCAWDVATGKERYRLPLQSQEWTQNPASGGTIAGALQGHFDPLDSVGEAGKARAFFWDANTGLPRPFPNISMPARARALVLSQDGRQPNELVGRDQNASAKPNRLNPAGAD
jgi:WD40 repeat protein